MQAFRVTGAGIREAGRSRPRLFYPPDGPGGRSGSTGSIAAGPSSTLTPHVRRRSAGCADAAPG